MQEAQSGEDSKAVSIRTRLACGVNRPSEPDCGGGGARKCAKDERCPLQDTGVSHRESGRNALARLPVGPEKVDIKGSAGMPYSESKAMADVLKDSR